MAAETIIHAQTEAKPRLLDEIRFALRTQRLVRQAGGLWNRERKVWEIRYDQIKSLGLTDRIVDKESFLY